MKMLKYIQTIYFCGVVSLTMIACGFQPSVPESSNPQAEISGNTEMLSSEAILGSSQEQSYSQPAMEGDGTLSSSMVSSSASSIWKPSLSSSSTVEMNPSSSTGSSSPVAQSSSAMISNPVAQSSSTAPVPPPISSSAAVISSLTTGRISINYSRVQGAPTTYAPKNVNATWITDANGKWVKNLFARAGTRAKYLYNWRGDYTKTITTGVDGVAGATAASLSPISADSSVAGLPLGSYILHMEFTSGNGQGPYATIPFDLKNVAFSKTENFTNFQNVQFIYTP